MASSPDVLSELKGLTLDIFLIKIKELNFLPNILVNAIQVMVSSQSNLQLNETENFTIDFQMYFEEQSSIALFNLTCSLYVTSLLTDHS